MRLRTLTGVALLVTLSACNFSGIVGPTDLVYLGVAKARWEQRPFANYSYEIRTLCFCPPELNEWTRVSVVDGVVVQAAPVESPDELSTSLVFQPIDSLFANLYRAMSESGRGTVYSKILVDYHPELGYPRNVEYRARRNILDAGAVINVRNVVPLN